MFYALKPVFKLRGWLGLPYAIVREGSASPYFLAKKIFDVLCLCNGRVDFSIPLVTDEQRKIVFDLKTKGIVEEGKEGFKNALKKEQEYKQYPAKFIETAHWSITGKCNYKCRHCYMSAPNAKLGELSTETIFNIIDQLKYCGIRSVSLTGGEPLVRKDFWEIIDYLLKNNIIVTIIYSNGALVTDEFVKNLKDRDLCPEINMSFDGVGCHDWLRGVDGAESAVNSAFRLCKKHNIPTAAEMCIHEKNKNTLRQTINHLATLGCLHLKVSPVSDVGAWRENGYGESIPVRELFRIYLNYIPHFYEDGAPIGLQLGGFFNGRKGDTTYFGLPSSRKGQNPKVMCVCNHARNNLYISPEGRALPCFSLSGMDIQYEYPLITEIGLKNCLNDSKYMNLIETKAQTVLEHNKECTHCEHKLLCMGGCRASALNTSPSDILSRDMCACEYYKGGWFKKVEKAAKKAIESAKKYACKVH